MFLLDHLFWEHYKDKDTSMAILHQQKRVQYHASSFPRATFIWAWGLEELSDNQQKLYKQAKLSLPSPVSSRFVCG